jgi:cytoskeleton protein RodZ
MTDEVRNDATSAGAMLRAAREARGMHIGVLAASIKVAQRKLEALEADRHDELPDITFTRALAQAVCRALKIDPDPVLARLPQPGVHAQRLEHVSAGLNAPFREHAARLEPARAALAFRRPVVWATALVLVAAAAIALLPDNLWQRVEPVPQPQPMVAPPAPLPEPAASVTIAPQEPVATPTPAPATAQQPPAVQTPAVPAAPAPTALVRAREATWVQVEDARGRVLLSRVLGAGEAVGLDGTPPLRVRIGNAPATELEFRGQPVDLAPRTGRDNVAQVELK